MSFVIGHFIVTLVFGLLMLGRTGKPKTIGRQKILTYPWTIKMMCLAGFILMNSAFYYMWMRSPEQRWQVSAIMIPLCTIFLVGLIELFGKSISFDEYCIFQNSPWSSQRSVPWADIVEVKYSNFRSSYLLTAGNPGNVRIHEYMNGIQGLLQALALKQPGNESVTNALVRLRR